MKSTSTHLLLTFIGWIFLCGCGQSAPVNTTHSIIPAPNSIEYKKGHFTLSPETTINLTDSSLYGTAVYLRDAVLSETGLNIPVRFDVSHKKAISLEKLAQGSDEEYILNIDKNQILCQAATEVGVFYAVQSILQSMQEDNTVFSVPCMKIEDKPLYGWRGFMLDESRHFFGKEVVMQYLDIMARLKMNRFHWHLTDEPAWRIEIKKYPLLTEIGSKGSWSDNKAEARYYTQEEIREIVQYATDRHIMVIPEIDMPGHATSATNAYPYLSGGGTGKWKGFTFHPAKETTYTFIEDVFAELGEMFPSPYIHMGADEVHFGNQSWKTDRIMQDFIRKNNLGDELGLEHYFIRRVNEIIKKQGKKMLGWDEIIHTGVSNEDATAIWWRHDKPELLKEGLQRGFPIIIAPRLPCYLDFVQDASHKIGRRWGEEFNTLSSTYDVSDSIQPLISGKENLILGLQANIWTERIKDKKRLDFMVFPRLVAVAENGWTHADNKDYTGFEQRLAIFMKFLDKLNVYYFNVFDKESTPEPWGPEKEDPIANG